jgi:hypothetical protein
VFAIEAKGLVEQLSNTQRAQLRGHAILLKDCADINIAAVNPFTGQCEFRVVNPGADKQLSDTFVGDKSEIKNIEAPCSTT